MSHDQSRSASTLLGFKVLSSQSILHSSGRFPHTHTFPSCDVSSNTLASPLTHNLNLLASSHTHSLPSYSPSDFSMTSSHEQITTLPPLIDVSDAYLSHSSSALPHPSHIRRRSSNPSVSSVAHVTLVETRRATPHATHTPHFVPSDAGAASGSGNASKPALPRKHSHDRFKVVAEGDTFSESSPRADTRPPRPEPASADAGRRTATEAERAKKIGNAPRPPSGAARVLTSPRKKPAQASSPGKRTSGKTAISGDPPSEGPSSARKAPLATGRISTGKATAATSLADARATTATATATASVNVQVGAAITTAAITGSPARKHARPADTHAAPSRQPCPPRGPPPPLSHSRRTRTLNAASAAAASTTAAVAVPPAPAVFAINVAAAAGACVDARSRAPAETATGPTAMQHMVPRDSPRRTLQPESPPRHSAGQSSLPSYAATDTTTASTATHPSTAPPSTVTCSATPSSSLTPPFGVLPSAFLSPESALATETWDTVIPTRAPEPLQCTCAALPPSVLSVGDKAGYFHARLSEAVDTHAHARASADAGGAVGTRTDPATALGDDDDDADHYLHMRITRRPACARTEVPQPHHHTQPHAHAHTHTRAPAGLTEADAGRAGCAGTGRASSSFAVSAGRRERAACPVHGGRRGMSQPAAAAAPSPLDHGVDANGDSHVGGVGPGAVEVEVEAAGDVVVGAGGGVRVKADGVSEAAVADAARSSVEPCDGGDDGGEEDAATPKTEAEAEAEVCVPDSPGAGAAVDAVDTDAADPASLLASAASVPASQTRKTVKKGQSKGKKRPEPPTASAPRPDAKPKKAKDTKKDKKDKKDKAEKAEKVDGRDRRQSSGAHKAEDRGREAATEGAGGADALALAALLRVQAHRKQLQTDKLRQEEQEWLRRNQRQLRQREEDAVVAWERARMYMVNHAYQLLVERQFQEFVEAKRKGKETSRAVINFS